MFRIRLENALSDKIKSELAEKNYKYYEDGYSGIYGLLDAPKENLQDIEKILLGCGANS